MEDEEIPVEETPAVEEQEPVEEPVVEETPVEFDWEDEAIRQRAIEALQFSEKYSSQASDIERALQLDAALKTEDGITQLFLQAGKALGFGPDELEKVLFPGEAPAEEVEEEDEDRVLTLREAKELLAKQVFQPAAEAERVARESAARDAINSTLADLKITDEVERQAVLAMADQHIAPNDLSPESVRAAIRKAYTAYEAAAKARAEEYIRAKLKDQAKVPGSISGKSAGGDELPEPQNVEEARARVRARLFGK